ncbi:hypothetical protein ABZT03_19115 [Streptomyces sp. NPDC005574]|uniref:hypothetical protein n=1 Tax=Streptomyces sp. NPDC005574 TaxID=3156891 RepID=UPI0033B83C33
MSDTTLAPGGQDAPAVDRLDTLTAALAQDLAGEAWRPGPLERWSARRLLDASAADGEPTAERIRAVLWEGAIALPHAGEGRLAALLAHLLDVAGLPVRDATAARQRAMALLERVAEPEGEDDHVHH